MPRPFTLPCIVSIIVVLAGCASKNYSTTLKPRSHSLDTLQAKFRIDHIDSIPPLIFYASGFTDDDYWATHVKGVAKTDSFAQQLREMAAARYPELFSGAPEALGIDVRFTISDYHESSTKSWFLTAVSWGVFGIILPLPIIMQYNCALLISFPDLPADHSMSFRNRLVTWVSFPSPLALMPVPSPVSRRAYVVYPWQTTYYSGRLFTLECFCEALLQAMETIDRERAADSYKKKCAAKEFQRQPVVQ